MNVFRKSERREGFSKGPTQKCVFEERKSSLKIQREFCAEHCLQHLCLNVSFQGTISVGIDATDLFDRYEEDFEDMAGGGFPHVEINKMHISQSIEVIVLYSVGN